MAMKEYELTVRMTNVYSFTHSVLAASYADAVDEAWKDFPEAEDIN